MFFLLFCDACAAAELKETEITMNQKHPEAITCLQYMYF